jgi:hypothetical protein
VKGEIKVIQRALKGTGHGDEVLSQVRPHPLPWSRASEAVSLPTSHVMECWRQESRSRLLQTSRGLASHATGHCTVSTSGCRIRIPFLLSHRGNHGESIADEALHLTAAMQYCGFRSVVGTMWEMADTDGRDLAKSFYESLFSSQETGVPYYERSARALRDATQKLRRKRGITLERWVNFVHYGA